MANRGEPLYIAAASRYHLQTTSFTALERHRFVISSEFEFISLAEVDMSAGEDVQSISAICRHNLTKTYVMIKKVSIFRDKQTAKTLLKVLQLSAHFNPLSHVAAHKWVMLDPAQAGGAPESGSGFQLHERWRASRNTHDILPVVHLELREPCAVDEGHHNAVGGKGGGTGEGVAPGEVSGDDSVDEDDVVERLQSTTVPLAATGRMPNRHVARPDLVSKYARTFVHSSMRGMIDIIIVRAAELVGREASPATLQFALAKKQSRGKHFMVDEYGEAHISATGKKAKLGSSRAATAQWKRQQQLETFLRQQASIKPKEARGFAAQASGASASSKSATSSVGDADHRTAAASVDVIAAPGTAQAHSGRARIMVFTANSDHEFIYRGMFVVKASTFTESHSKLYSRLGGGFVLMRVEEAKVALLRERDRIEAERRDEHEKIMRRNAVSKIRVLDLTDAYIVTPLLATHLSDVMRGPQDLHAASHVRYITYQLLRALKYIHSAGVIHNNIEPSAIQIDENCDLSLQIESFAIASEIQRGFRERSSTATATEQRGGNLIEYTATDVRYCAPEILLGTTATNESVDVWSVGCILAQMLRGGRILFHGDTYFSVLESVLAAMPYGINVHEEASFVNNPFALSFLKRVVAEAKGKANAKMSTAAQRAARDVGSAQQQHETSALTANDLRKLWDIPCDHIVFERPGAGQGGGDGPGAKAEEKGATASATKKTKATHTKAAASKSETTQSTRGGSDSGSGGGGGGGGGGQIHTMSPELADGIDLLRLMLSFDSATRISVDDALQHRFVKQCVSDDERGEPLCSSSFDWRGLAFKTDERMGSEGGGDAAAWRKRMQSTMFDHMVRHFPHLEALARAKR